MADRRGPKDGYDFGPKRDYRRAVWGAIRDGLNGKVAQAHALLMPSIEGVEIDIAKRFGFKERNLHVVDYNPAIVATLKRRYSEINTYGVTVARAVERIADKGLRLSAANFDFTGCVSASLLSEVEAISRVDPFAGQATVSITLLRGRERSEVFDGLRYFSTLPHVNGQLNADINTTCVSSIKPSDNDVSRVFAMFSHLMLTHGGFWRPRRNGIYRSSTQTMLWCVSDIISLKGYYACIAEFDRRLEEMRAVIKQAKTAKSQSKQRALVAKAKLLERLSKAMDLDVELYQSVGPSGPLDYADRSQAA